LNRCHTFKKKKKKKFCPNQLDGHVMKKLDYLLFFFFKKKLFFKFLGKKKQILKEIIVSEFALNPGVIH
jgi:hypothetical protein